MKADFPSCFPAEARGCSESVCTMLTLFTLVWSSTGTMLVFMCASTWGLTASAGDVRFLILILKFQTSGKKKLYLNVNAQAKADNSEQNALVSGHHAESQRGTLCQWTGFSFPFTNSTPLPVCYSGSQTRTRINRWNQISLWKAESTEINHFPRPNHWRCQGCLVDCLGFRNQTRKPLLLLVLSFTNKDTTAVCSLELCQMFWDREQRSLYSRLQLASGYLTFWDCRSTKEKPKKTAGICLCRTSLETAVFYFTCAHCIVAPDAPHFHHHCHLFWLPPSHKSSTALSVHSFIAVNANYSALFLPYFLAQSEGVQIVVTKRRIEPHPSQMCFCKTNYMDIQGLCVVTHHQQMTNVHKPCGINDQSGW